MAERVGIEPTGAFTLTDAFKATPLLPLRYLSVFVVPPKRFELFPDGLKVRCAAADTKEVFLVGETGFEPVKSVTTDLQSAPFDRTWILSHIGASSGI